MTWLVLGGASALAWAAGCGGSSDTLFKGGGGNDAGSAASGGSAGSGSGGTSGSGSGGTSGSGSGGTSGTGGSAGAGTGGSAGAGTGGSAGAGTGGSAGAGTGGSAGAGTGGSAGADACVPSKWCHDEDNDGYGNPNSTVTSCSAPGANWIESGSKARACEDCNDANANVHPLSNYCDGIGYKVGSATAVSFDFNCDGTETECGTTQKADPNGCQVSSGGSVLCVGSGYLPTARSGAKQNPYCGSTKYRQCSPGVGTVDSGVCTETVHNDYNPITCK